MAGRCFTSNRSSRGKKMGIKHKLLPHTEQRGPPRLDTFEPIPFAFSTIAILWLAIDFFSEQCARCTLYLSEESAMRELLPPRLWIYCLLIQLFVWISFNFIIKRLSPRQRRWFAMCNICFRNTYFHRIFIFISRRHNLLHVFICEVRRENFSSGIRKIYPILDLSRKIKFIEYIN